jgi:lysophospholipase L1-like esterase
MAERDRAVSQQRRRSALTRILGTVLLFFCACAIAILAGEGVIRLLKPGFPGFKTPQVEHRPVAGLGFEMVPKQVAYTAGERVTINEDGFRGPPVRDPLSSRLRILCIGDSITFGYGVDDNAPFPRQLEQLLRHGRPEHHDAEVINAGVQRYFTYQEIDLLRFKGPRLRPDIVVLAVFVNDLAIRPQGDTTREYEKEREQAATAFRNRLPFVYGLAKNSALVELTKNAYLQAGAGPGGLRMFEGVATQRDEERWKSMGQELAAFSQLAREHGFLPVVVAIPGRIQVQKEFPRSLFPNRLLMLARQEGLESLDVLASFRESFNRGVDPYLPWDNHLSSDGHALVARAIFKRLMELPPPLKRADGSVD